MAGKPGRSGGARPGSGPPPAEHSRAKDRAKRKAAKSSPAKAIEQPSIEHRTRGVVAVLDDGEWLTLPREGRTSNPPAWPLDKCTTREREIWNREWKRPQALAWERVGISTDVVAMYVRTLARAEQPGSALGLITLVRQFADLLGLTGASMRQLRWRIGQRAKLASTPDPVPSTRLEPGVSPKARLTIVKSDAG